MWVGGQRHGTAALQPGKMNPSRCTEGWVGLGACLDRYGKRQRPPPPQRKKLKKKTKWQFLNQHQHAFLESTEHSGHHR